MADRDEPTPLGYAQTNQESRFQVAKTFTTNHLTPEPEKESEIQISSIENQAHQAHQARCKKE